MKFVCSIFIAADIIMLSALSGCTGAPDDKKISSIIDGFNWSGFYTFSLKLGGLKAYFDPDPAKVVRRLGKDDFNTAGIIFVTHDDSHLGDDDVKSMIEALTNNSTIIVMPSLEAFCLTNRNPGYNVKGLLPGKSIKIGELDIKTVPAYDIVLSDMAMIYHPRSNNWLGYIITTGGVRIYYTGATQLIPEMRNIRCDILISDIYLKPEPDISPLVTLARWTGAKVLIPLGYAPNVIYSGQLEKARKALSGTCSIVIPAIDYKQETLFDAAAKGDTVFIKNYKGDINSKNNYGWTAVITAAYYGRAAAVRALAEKGADVNAADNEGNTVLMIAALNGRTDSVKALIKAGANVNALHENGWMPLMMPAAFASNHPGGGTALMDAARCGYTDTVKILIEAGADVNELRFDGKTVLMEAAYYGYADVVKALINKGAGVNAADKFGRTALIYASYKMHTDIVKALKEAGAK